MCKKTITLILFSFTTSVAFAASPALYFQASSPQIPLGSEVTVKIFVDSTQPLNAYAVELRYPLETLGIVNFDNSGSRIDVWKNQPLAFTDGRIFFQGGSFSPFVGEEGELLVIHFRAKQIGYATLQFQNSQVYLANGKGTAVTPLSQNITLEVTPATSSTAASAPSLISDLTPPTIKLLSFIPDPFRADRKLLSFLVVDPDSGVKATLMRSRTWLWWNSWQQVVSPTALPAGVWAVDFKVLDNAGNAVEKTLYDWPLLWRKIVIAVLLVAVAGVVVINRVRKSDVEYNKNKL